MDIEIKYHRTAAGGEALRRASDGTRKGCRLRRMNRYTSAKPIEFDEEEFLNDLEALYQCGICERPTV